MLPLFDSICKRHRNVAPVAGCFLNGSPESHSCTFHESQHLRPGHKPCAVLLTTKEFVRILVEQFPKAWHSAYSQGTAIKHEFQPVEYARVIRVGPVNLFVSVP
jgi:hypothetical protein